MSDEFRVKVDGYDKIFAALRDIERTARGKIVRRVLREASKLIHGATVARAPKKSGKLARSHKVKATKRSRGKIGVKVVAGGLGAAKKGAHESNRLANQTFYGAFVLFGHHIGSRKHRLRIKAEPQVRKPGQRGRLKEFDYVETRRFAKGNNWMQEAWKAEGPELKARLPLMFWQEIEAVARKHGRNVKRK